jgi:hypothetical protein
VSGLSGNAIIKFDYVEKVFVDNSSIWVKNYTTFPSGAPYALSMENMAEVNTISLAGEYRITNSYIGGRVLNGGYNMYADNVTFDVGHMEALYGSYNTSLSGNSNFAFNNCRFLGSSSYALVENNSGFNPTTLEINNSEFRLRPNGNAFLGGNLSSLAKIRNLSNPLRQKITPTFGESETLSRHGDSLGTSAQADFGVGRTFKGDGVPTTGTFSRGDLSYNSGWSGGDLGANDPLYWICTESGSPGTWIANYLNRYNDLHVENILNVEGELHLEGDGGVIKKNPSGGGMMLKPGFNAANQFGVSIHNFAGTEIVVFDDGGNANFKTTAEFQNGIDVQSGNIIMNSGRLAGLPTPTYDNDATPKVYVDAGLLTSANNLDSRIAPNLSIQSGTSEPEGSVVASPGEMYVSIVSETAKVWIKSTGSGNTGWIQL